MLTPDLSATVRPCLCHELKSTARSYSDYGWAEASWHRNYSIGGVSVPFTDEVHTPNLDSLVSEGIELDRGYVRQPHIDPRDMHAKVIYMRFFANLR